MYLLPDELNSEAIRDWWHSLLREHGPYPAYAFFLVLASDTDATSYLLEYGTELDNLSGQNCLIIVFNKTKIRRSGIDTTLRPLSRGPKDPHWIRLVKDLLKEDYCV